MEVKETNLATDDSGYKIYFGKDNEISVDCARMMAAELYGVDFYTRPSFISDYLVIAAMGSLGLDIVFEAKGEGLSAVYPAEYFLMENHDARLTPEFCKRLLEMKRKEVWQ